MHDSIIMSKVALVPVLRLVGRGPFARLFWGKMISFGGVWLHVTVAGIVVYDATGSAFQVGLVTLLQSGPQVVLAPYAGARTDKGSPAGQMLLGRLICTAGAAILVPWILLTAPDQVRVFGVLVASLVIGVGFALGGVAQVSIISSLVERRWLGLATTLNSVPMTLGRVLGPVLGALIAVGISPAAAFAIAAFAHALFSLLIYMTRWPSVIPPAPGADLRFAAAWRYVRSHGRLGALLGVVALAGLAAEPATSLAPALAGEFERGDAQAALAGAIATAFGVGLAAGYGVLAVLGSWLAWSRLIHLGAAMMSIALATAAFTESSAVVLIALGVLGAGFCVAFTVSTSQIQLSCADAFRGRVMSMWLVAFIGTRPVAALAQGSLADLVGTDVTMFVTALLPGGLSVLVLICGARAPVVPSEDIRYTYRQRSSGTPETSGPVRGRTSGKEGV